MDAIVTVTQDDKRIYTMVLSEAEMDQLIYLVDYATDSARESLQQFAELPDDDEEKQFWLNELSSARSTLHDLQECAGEFDDDDDDDCVESLSDDGGAA